MPSAALHWVRGGEVSWAKGFVHCVWDFTRGISEMYEDSMVRARGGECLDDPFAVIVTLGA
ncbi:hypothetical protein AA12717_0035 [Gluconacetobacter sacchari DSM 12717]|uniref:Uncharacterized protein n=1 Tax=Gluconacetobacter sacchari DSM 12717 TaxID=1307940 RepID=A0ABQ0P1T6_9PROT|nr:hypothetical protein AA12717_0035 [Gluconacetobacter sacchari DSM 12717]